MKNFFLEFCAQLINVAMFGTTIVCAVLLGMTLSKHKNKKDNVAIEETK